MPAQYHDLLHFSVPAARLGVQKKLGEDAVGSAGQNRPQGLSMPFSAIKLGAVIKRPIGA